MKTKVSEATPHQLDLLVASITRPGRVSRGRLGSAYCWDAWGRPMEYLPSTDWQTGGPIIEREGIDLIYERNCDGEIVQIWAQIGEDIPPEYFGDTGLIAAMRCFVASKLGDEVEIPGELQ